MPFPSPPTVFPLYLFPSLPFRRRRSSTETTSSTFSSTSPSSNSPPISPLSSSASYLRCSKCLTDLCPTTSIISKGFNGRHGRAYLVSPPSQLPSSSSRRPRTKNDLLNTKTQRPVTRQLVTGAHQVSDIQCAVCGQVVGWKYVSAAEESQKYKVGKFILETKMTVKAVCWEGEDTVEDADAAMGKWKRDPMEFDSGDEDECDELFAGTWTPETAAGIRKRKDMRRGLGDDTF